MTNVLYVRTSDENHAWLRQISTDSGLSLAKTVDALFNYCRKQGITFVSEVRLVGEKPG